MRVEDFNDLFMKELNSWQKDYFPHLKEKKEESLEEENENIDIDSNTPNKYENIIFGNITVFKAVKGIKAFTEKTILPLDKPNTNWDVFLMKNLNDALLELENLKTKLGKTKFVKILFLQTHGQDTSIGFKGTNITAPLIDRTKIDFSPEYGYSDYSGVDLFTWKTQYLPFLESKKDLETYVKDKGWDLKEATKLYEDLLAIQIFHKITDFIQDNGTLILGGCFCGEIDKDLPENNVMSFLAKTFFNYKFNIIANQDFTSNTTNIKDEKFKKEGKKVPKQYFFLNQNLTAEKDYKKGWRIIKIDKTEDNTKKNLQLLSTGNPYVFIP